MDKQEEHLSRRIDEVAKRMDRLEDRQFSESQTKHVVGGTLTAALTSAVITGAFLVVATLLSTR